MSFGYQRLTEGSDGTANEVVFATIDAGGAESVQIASGNGTSYFEAIVAGTVLGKITASGKYRPCGKQVVNGAYGPGVVIPMQSVDGFLPGDIVSIYDVSANTTLATSRTINAINKAVSPPTITISGANVSVDPGDYVYVQDGSGTARGYLRAGVFTQVGVEPDGDPVYVDQAGLLVFRANINESEANKITKHNTQIKTDLQTATNGCWIIYR